MTTRTATQAGTLDHRQMWKDIVQWHTDAWTDNHDKRTPITIMANYLTLNMLIGGEPQKSIFLFDKVVLRTSLGDIYFRPHKGYDDGELAFL